MALINCPECHKEISDGAERCPNCGFVNSTSNSTGSKLSEVKRNRVSGSIFIFVGLVAVLGGIPMITIIIGIFAIIGGLVCIGLGINKFSGVQSGSCPYCNNQITIGAKALTLACPHCKKRSTRDGDYLRILA